MNFEPIEDGGIRYAKMRNYHLVGASILSVSSSISQIFIISSDL